MAIPTARNRTSSRSEACSMGWRRRLCKRPRLRERSWWKRTRKTGRGRSCLRGHCESLPRRFGCEVLCDRGGWRWLRIRPGQQLCADYTGAHGDRCCHPESELKHGYEGHRVGTGWKQAASNTAGNGDRARLDLPVPGHRQGGTTDPFAMTRKTERMAVKRGNL